MSFVSIIVLRASIALEFKPSDKSTFLFFVLAIAILTASTTEVVPSYNDAFANSISVTSATSD